MSSSQSPQFKKRGFGFAPNVTCKDPGQAFVSYETFVFLPNSFFWGGLIFFRNKYFSLSWKERKY